MKSGDHVGRYVLLEELGTGSHGRVWSAYLAHSPGHRFALKLIQPTTPDAARRLEHEARTLASLGHGRHVSLPQVYELFQLPSVSGEFVLVMELIQGQTLAQCGTRLLPGQRDILLRSLVGVLAFLHSRGVVHRDLKMDNVLVSDNFWSSPCHEAVKLVDFGIAFSSHRTRITELGTVIGAFRYLPPEVAVGPPRWNWLGTEPDGPTRDVFALGVLGWMLQTGQHPTGLSSCETPAQQEGWRQFYLRMAAEGRLEDWPAGQVLEPWASLLRRCLSLNPARRPRDAQDLKLLLMANQQPAIDLDPTNPIQRGPVVLLSPAAEQAPVRAPSSSAPEVPPLQSRPDAISWSPTAPLPSALPQVGPSEHPLVQARPPSSRTTKRRVSGLFVAGGAVSLLLMLVVGGLVFPWEDQGPSRSLSPTPRASAARSSTARAVGSPTTLPVATSPAPPLPTAFLSHPTSCPPECCSPRCCNTSPGKCLPGSPCPLRDCSSAPSPAEHWIVRPLGGRKQGVNWPASWRPDSRVCLSLSRLPSVEKCWAMVRSGFIATTPGEGLAANTDDLTDLGLDVTIRSAHGGVIMAWKNQKRKGMSSKILRESFTFNLERDPSDKGNSVSLALDEAP